MLGAAEERGKEATGIWIEVRLSWASGRDTMGSEAGWDCSWMFLPPLDGRREAGQGTGVLGIRCDAEFVLETGNDMRQKQYALVCGVVTGR
jgi:hypothetical protein